MKRVVCAGPTLHGVDRSDFGMLEFHSPAARGDLLRHASDGASAILVIDGYFGDRPSVSHKEILYVLSRGIPVMGAASLGALRAAECSGFGMEGIGKIFGDYRAGVRVSDSDVAVTHAPEQLGWHPLSIALVDVDATLDAVPEHLEPGALSTIRSVAKDMHFADRTWPRIVREAGLKDSIADILADRTVHLKRQDASEALRKFSGELTSPAELDFQQTATLMSDLGRYVNDT